MRRYGIDWLRIFGIFLLFPFHTARVFDYLEPNYIQGAPNWFSSGFIIGTSFWFMPLLFLIAGFSSFYALQKRSAGAYVCERTFRLLIPFLFGMVLVVPIQAYLARIFHFGYTGDYFTFLASYFTNFSDLSGYFGTFTPAHLWFILFLFVISLCLLPLMKKINRLPGTKPKVLLTPGVFLLAFLPITLLDAVPGLSGKNIFFYAGFFMLGYFIARTDGLLEALKKFRFKALACAAVAVPAAILLEFTFNWPSGITPIAAVTALVRNFAAWLVLIVLLGFSDAHLNRESRVLSYLNRAAFPVYILHQSLMMVVAFFVVKWNIPDAAKFIVIMLGTLAASLLGFEALRRFKTTRFIFGIK